MNTPNPKGTLRERAEQFFRDNYENPVQFRFNVRMLLTRSYPPECSEPAIRALHPLSRSNPHGWVVAGLAAASGIPMADVISYYKALPREQRAALDKIIDEEVDDARRVMLEDALELEPELTARLRQYELDVRRAVFRDSAELINTDPSCWLILALYDALNLRSWGMRVSDVRKAYRSLKPHEQREVSRIAAEALRDPHRNLADALRDGFAGVATFEPSI